MKIILLSLGAFLLISIVVISIWVERESNYQIENLGGDGKAWALILYHPSRDAHFSDDISLAVARGLLSGGLSVERATITGETPSTPKGYVLIVFVSNTYYWTPDLPTLHYLERAILDDVPVVGIIGGVGATGRSERLLGAALAGTGAKVLQTRSYWIFRPNDEARMEEPNRGVALDLAKQLGEKYADIALSAP